MPGIVITAQPNNAVSIDRRTYSVTADALAKTGSLEDVLRNIPSVDISAQGSISLRGDTHVTILIDGKPAPQFQTQNPGDALQAIPANLIDKVEVMSTASAEFTSVGSAGVINIVTKKSLPPGASLTLNGAFGPDGRGRAGFTGGYSQGKLSITADGSFRREPRVNKIRLDSLATSTGGDQVNLSNYDSHGQYEAANAGLKATYQIDPKTQIYGGYRINYQTATSRGLEAGATGPVAGPLTPSPTLDQALALTYDLKTISAGLSHSFSGDEHEFTADFQHWDYPTKEVALTTLADGGSGPGPRFQEDASSAPLAMDQIKLAYRRPMPLGGRLVVGSDWQHNDLQVNTFALDGASAQAATIDPLYGNRYREQEDQLSYYGTYQQPLGKLTLMAGLRVETDNVSGHAIGIDVAGQNYAKFNPSLNASYPLNADSKITFGYSRRMDRPSGLQYDPAPLYIDQYLYLQGNPYLRPSTTDALEATWDYSHAGAGFTATAYYRQARNVISYIDTPDGGGVFTEQYVNFGQKRDAGVSLAASGHLLKALKYDLSADIYDAQTRNAGVAGVNQEGWVEAGHANFDWSPTAVDLFQLNAVFKGRTFLPQGYAQPSQDLNLGYRRQLTGSLFLTVSADNLLGSYGDYIAVLNTPGLIQHQAYRYNKRAVMFGLSWSFDGAPGKTPVIDYSSGAGL